MKSQATPPKDVNQYIDGQPKQIQIMLKQMRAAIQQAAPDAQELISYQMPAYKYHGMLLYFAGHTGHIGFYPLASAVTKFKKELAGYKISKGTVQFPLDQPLPLSLLSKIVSFRVKENFEKARLTTSSKKAGAK